MSNLMNYDDLASKRDLWTAIRDLTAQVLVAFVLYATAIIVLMVIIDQRIDAVESHYTEHHGPVIMQPADCPQGLVAVEKKKC